MQPWSRATKGGAPRSLSELRLLGKRFPHVHSNLLLDEHGRGLLLEVGAATCYSQIQFYISVHSYLGLRALYAAMLNTSYEELRGGGTEEEQEAVLKGVGTATGFSKIEICFRKLSKIAFCINRFEYLKTFFEVHQLYGK